MIFKEVRNMYFAYGKTEVSYLRRKDKRLCAVIDQIGHIDRAHRNATAAVVGR